MFELDPTARELRKRGLRLRLQDQPFRVLTTLLESPGRIVTREELQSQLWAGDTFVDFNHGLNSAVNRIRQVLGDSASNPRFIETVPKVGYRFIAPVTTASAAPSPPAQRSAHSHPTTPMQQDDVPAAAPQYGAETDAARLRYLPGVLAVAAVLALSYLLGSFAIESLSSGAAQPPTVSPSRGPWAIRLLAGSRDAATDGEGIHWSADSYHSGGSTANRNTPVRSGPSSESGRAEPILYAAERYGNFRYSVPAPPGEYDVRLYFAETWFGAGNSGGGGEGSRKFQVLLNGAVWLDGFDILAEAGGANREVVVEKAITLQPDTGRIVLDFVSQVQNAAVNAVEITPRR